MMLTRPEQLRIDLPLEAIARVCQKHGVSELAVFGSVLRDDFDPARSDVDFLVEFDTSEGLGSLFHRHFGLTEALEQLFDCKVDLVSAGALRNPYLIASVNRSRETVYASTLAETA